MPLLRSASKTPPLRRSRSASMSSLAQVDLGTLDQDIVLDYARKVMQLQPQPATSSEKLQMLFALSQKLLKWFLEDRERANKCWNSLDNSNTIRRTEADIPTLNIRTEVPQSRAAQQSKEIEKPSEASRIIAAAVAPVTAMDIKLAVNLDPATESKSTESPIQISSVRPADPVMTPVSVSPNSVVKSLQSDTENEPLLIDSTPSTTTPEAQTALKPQEANPLPPPKQDALQLYLQVQRSVICIQKYIRGFMARRRFFRALEELVQGPYVVFNRPPVELNH